MRAAVATLLLALGASACGKSADEGPEERKNMPTVPAQSPSSTPKRPTPPAPGMPDTKELAWVGTVEPAGIGITMQGTHKLVEGGRTVALLEGKAVDLKAYEGKRVRVTGKASATVEGNQTIVEVATIEEVR